MKSEIIEKEKELKFPCLMVSEETGNVYLMKSEKSGTCVHVAGGFWLIGTSRDTLDPKILIPFEGKIILQND